MRIFSSANVAFDAAHRLDHEPCNLVHGHHWEVEVVVENLRNDPRLALDLAKSMDSLKEELAFRDLGVMLPAVVITPEGIGTYFRERLMNFFPTLTEVRVRNGVSSATILQEKR